MHPQERDGGGSFDAAAINVSCGAGNDTPNDETDNDTDVLKEWRTEQLRQDDGNEGQEAKTDELRGAPSA